MSKVRLIQIWRVCTSLACSDEAYEAHFDDVSTSDGGTLGYAWLAEIAHPRALAALTSVLAVREVVGGGKC